MHPSWNSLPPRVRLVWASALGLLVLLLALAGWWTLRSEQAVLFSDLRPQDAATLTTELEKLKVAYVVADNGATLLVDRSQVHALRLKLMGRDLPLHGTVGLELFNNTDFGMTEFAQKVNLQRALQGELTRTILSFAEIRDARVHLAMPEQGLFRQNAVRAKAAVTLTLRAGRSLRQEQVAGIQRLVAAAVPGLSVQEVTILDQQGVALSRAADTEAEGGGAAARLDLKRDMENYLSRKAGAVLEQAFGPGQALASVDVTLNMDQVRVTTEDVIAAPDAKGGVPAGVLVRERESARDSATPDARAPDVRGARGSSMQRDAEYQAGRRVEHVVSQPGTIRRVQVVALVRQTLDAQQRAEVQALVAAAVGASPERGDTVVVQVLQPVVGGAGSGEAAPAVAVAPAAAVGDGVPGDVLRVGLALLVLVLAAFFLWRRRVPAQPRAVQLTTAEREAALEQVQTWMLQAATEVERPLPTAGRSS